MAAQPPATIACRPQPGPGADPQVQVSEQKGRASVEVSRPNNAADRVGVEYGDDLYVQKFGADGRARVLFALTASESQFTIQMNGVKALACHVGVPEFSKIYRVILRWHDPVQLDLNVLEPGGRLGENGNVSGRRPNSTLTQGVGQMDVVGGIPVPFATGEMSYVADAGALPPNTVLGFKVDFVTRGLRPEAPYCDDDPLAAPKFEFITIESGKVTVQKMSMNHARCGRQIPDNRRLMPIRQ